MTSEPRGSFVADASNLDAIVRRVLKPKRFFVARGDTLRLETTLGASEVWEIYSGQLLGAGQTRKQSVFDSWRLLFNPREEQAAQPLLEIKWERAERCLHVTRSLKVYGWETYEARQNVIESRAAKVWTRELVGSLATDQAASEKQIAEELETYVRMALTGTSRLAITSLENPLPQFSLGRLAYLPCRDTARQTPLDDPIQLLSEHAPGAEPASIDPLELEVALRAIDRADVPRLAAALALRLEATRTPRDAHRALFRSLFNQVALSPYTRFVDNLVDLLACLENHESIGAPAIVDTMSYMLRHLVRHLTAFDLKEFHNQGANYPDALFLDRLLCVYVKLIARHEDLFLSPSNRLRRRALRGAYYLRRSLEGVCFPDAPTSPGENQRVLPAEFTRVPEQQLHDPSTRSNKLFDFGSIDQLIDVAARDVLAASLADLEHMPELRELGMAVYLDRPLGVFHAPGHADRTPLVSYEAFSRKIAAERLDALCEAQPTLDKRALADRLAQFICPSLSLAQIGGAPRPSVVSLADAARSAEDFVFLRTTRSSLDTLLNTLFLDTSELIPSGMDASHWLENDSHVLLIRTRDHFLAGFDRDMRLRCTLDPIEPIQYTMHLGLEILRHGLRLTASP